jgi:hypothetical protein
MTCFTRRVRLWSLVGAAVLSLHGVAAGQDDSVEWRLRNVAGVRPEAVKRFLGDLQADLKAGARDRVCGVVQYPLKHQDRGNVTTRASCVRRFDEIFTPGVVRAVTSQAFSSLFVNSGGIMIGNGDVWMAGICLDEDCRRSRLQVIAVNHLEDQAQNPTKGKVLFACRAEGLRAQVTADGQGGVDLLLWRGKKRAGAVPDVFVPSGVYAPEGTAGCSHGIWRFDDAARHYELSELGCYPASNTPPAGSVGRFISSADGAAGELVFWCF